METMEAKVTSKGQITIPIEIRRILSLNQGDFIEFIYDSGRVLLQPRHANTDPFEKYAGHFAAFVTKEEVADWISDLRDEE